MRTLKFEKGSVEYTLLHRATLESGFKPTPKQYGIIANIQERLESIGKPYLGDDSSPNPNAVYHHHIEKAGYAVFEEEEFTVLKALFENTAFPNSLARFVKRVHDLLDKAVEEKPVAKLKKL